MHPSEIEIGGAYVNKGGKISREITSFGKRRSKGMNPRMVDVVVYKQGEKEGVTSLANFAKWARSRVHAPKEVT